MWDPAVYLRHADARARPFYDLLAQIGADAPRRVVDLGCGPGNLTATLAQRWPRAQIEGFDADPAMVEAAQRQGVAARQLDARQWRPEADTDVTISNAVLQWVPEHLALLTGWLAALPDGAWFAFQVPGNFDAPSHRLLHELIDTPAWRERLGNSGVLRQPVPDAAGYAAHLLAAGYTVDAWETTYVHLLAGPDPVLDWLSGTALRPIRAALDDAAWARFTAQLAPRLRDAYPAQGTVTPLPFRRVFVVARKG
ncbi:trans-aconitate 2-methyltransferase [Chitiniphilus eburneus]|uniref:Trans-aconitate 2-methyltransferase n=1 Tax=Chitiniphilus eburneus TaxID=2571148 RepID=A0A4U0PPM6_9NEIS|nr:trans-aconitate 2-methyltransferase [Chitiniphilus eburneus]TJZ70109.1 trans-aconitate 2-methyltransferase [Chitiniphilus eburneus]